MTFYIFFSAVVILAAVVGCIVIWGYDAVRADNSEADVRAALRPDLAPGPRPVAASPDPDRLQGAGRSLG